MPGGIVLGLDAKLYHNTGTYGTPTWDEIGNVKDLVMSIEKGTADVTTRTNSGWRAKIGTLKEATIEFQMVYDTDDADFEVLQTAFFANTLIEFAVMDGAIATTGQEGLRATMDITSFGRDEQLEQALMVPVKLEPSYSANAPAWYEVS